MITHKDIIFLFTKEFYTNNITLDKLPNDKKVLTEKEGNTIIGEKIGWELDNKEIKQRMFIPDEICDNEGCESALDLFPFKVKETTPYTFGGREYSMVKSINKFRIKPKKMLEFKKIVELFSNVKHSNPSDYKFYCLITLGSLIQRVNWRVGATKGFGKNSINDNIKFLFEDAQCRKIGTSARLGIECHKRNLLVFDEFMEAKKDKKEEMEFMLRSIGDYNQELENPALSSGSFRTKDVYDISNLSMVIIYNPCNYYKRKIAQYFDFIYTPATCERFLPLAFNEGTLDTRQFNGFYNVEKYYEQYKQIYLGVVKSIIWYRENIVDILEEKDKLGWVWKNEKIFGDTPESRMNGIADRFQNIFKVYADSEEEYNELCDKLYKHHEDYLNMVKDWRIEE